MKAFLYSGHVGLLVRLQEMTFKCVALLLGFAFASASVVADYCKMSCEAAHAGHHHASTAPSDIGQPPQPCGHDHHGIVGVAASSGAASVRPLAPTSAAVVPASPLAPSLWMLARDVHGSNSPPGTFLHGVASPLRV